MAYGGNKVPPFESMSGASIVWENFDSGAWKKKEGNVTCPKTLVGRRPRVGLDEAVNPVCRKRDMYTQHEADP